ncbi:MAG TPA: isochorismatase [Candidatus Dietzia intestinigallinarum]|nr:isochorismatase [Candidatus Dietzia intestinigallinarum]
MSGASQKLTEECIVNDVADSLGISPEEVDRDTDVIDVGLDSIRIMSLVEKWRAAGAIHVTFEDLASEPVISAWVDLLARGTADDAGILTGGAAE